MEIKFEIRGRCFSICLGHKTRWFEQLYFFTLIEEFYQKKEICYANLLLKF
jgi:hypothetical protein